MQPWWARRVWIESGGAASVHFNDPIVHCLRSPANRIAFAMKTSEEIREEQSQRIFWVVQTVFSLLLARSIFDYRDVIVHPVSPFALGLLLVYGTVLWSWIDYSYTTIVSPYRFDKGGWET